VLPLSELNLVASDRQLCLARSLMATGNDVAGRIKAVGEDVTEFKEGDKASY
jgi:NADPH:quinone reductase-like Zn-dependent oxidoreductase